MKKFSSVLLLILTIGITANAKTYYVSNSGNDNSDGLTTSTPWRTLAKVSSFTSLVAGDAVLFNRGDIFYGQLIINDGGSSGNPITIGAYGTGPDPIITGFTTVSAWTNLGSNIWESTNAISAASPVNMVVINGVNTPMGRYPNTGYLTYQSFSGKTSITSSSLSGSPNWTGAEAVIRKQRWIIDRNLITGQSGGTLTYIPSSVYDGQSGYGFFIQNDTRTLDLQNEWYYNPSSKKLRIYSTSAPVNVQVTTKDTLVFMKYRNYITFDNLSFQGSNKDAFVILSSSNITIQNCSIDYSGTDAIWGNQNWGQPSNNFVLKNSSINHTNNNAIFLASEFTRALISHNTFKNTGMIVGLGGSGDAMSSAVQTKADNAIIEYNEVDSVGYVGIGFYNDNTIVRNNFVNGFNFVKLDGAGIYTWVGVGNLPFKGQKVLNNIVMNGFGDNAGTTAGGNPISHGIYMDDWSANAEIAGNSVANCPHSGIYLHKAHDLYVHDNTSFNNNQYQILMVSSDLGSLIRRDVVKNNIYVSKASTQLVGGFQSVIDDISSFGTIDSNYYARPINDNVVFNVTINNYATYFQYNLAQWQAYSGFDVHSHKSPKTVSTVNDLRFEYNATSANKTIPLDGNYIDVKNVSYNGTITLAPYTSAVLIRNGAATNQPPTANAGSNQTITLPTSSVSLSGSGTDPDGTISAYNWTKVSGPGSAVITNASSASTTVTALVQGVYQFQLKVTDNDGAIDMDTVQVTVNGSANISPTASAGPDQSITLPTNSVTLSGGGTDPDGTISSYSWTQLAGPNSATKDCQNCATTSINGMIAGTYQFQLKVTDNDGAIDMDTVQVTVNGSANISPTANAGADRSITLPTNSVTLSGSGTDPDGTISAYNWIQLAGPNSVTKDCQSCASTLINGMIAGTYQFQLKVTDNDGAIAMDTVQVTVSASANIPPTANAGADQSITLPTDSVTLSGSGTDPDGTISSYNWIQLAGPNSVTKECQSCASTLISGMIEGTYKFQLIVTDNDSDTDRDTVQIIVYAATTLLPAVNPANTVNGLDYDYYESGSGWSVLPDFSTLTPVATGTTTNFDISSATSPSTFAFNFTGFINVPADGQYTFFTTSDDGSNLYIDNVLVVNNDGLHGAIENSGTIGLQAGKHAISVGYFQQAGDSALTVSYSGPGVSKQTIPASSLYRISSGLLPAVNPANTVNGLDYNYYESGSGWSVLPDFSTLTPVSTGTTTNFDVSSATSSITFAFNFTGFINVPADGQYTFYTTSDDGSNLYIDNVLVVDNDGLHSAIENSGTIGLQAGKHAISVGFFQQAGGSILNVSYSGPGISKQAVPASALYRISISGSRVALNNQITQAITSTTQIGVKAYPNPFGNNIDISITGGVAGDYKLMLTDASGKVVWTTRGVKNAGVFQQSVNTSAFRRGIYFLKVIQNNTNSVIKLVK